MVDVEAELRSCGVSVESVESGDPLSVVYLTAHPGREIDHGEIGRALNGLIDLVKTDQWEPVRVEGTVLRAPNDPLGTWHAESEWFRALVRYEITETEFSTRVLDTVDHHDTNGSGEDSQADTNSDSDTPSTREG
jgi:hypothetical protein